MPRRRLLLPLAAAFLGLAPAAGAAPRLQVRGAGFGHGVGMSQYGSEGYARQGWGHARILRHYYTGTSLGATDAGRPVRVLLGTFRAPALSHVNRAGGRRFDARRALTARVRGGRIVLGGRRLGPTVRATGTDWTAVGGRRYRGTLRLTAVSGAVQVVNVVGLDDYLQGVVPAEVFVSWRPAALEAQAIAARTYAITAGAGRLLSDTTASQVYAGMGREHPRTNAAVRATRGRVVTYGGLPVVTYYFSTSGGRTENVENSFLGAAPQPWLKSVPDRFDSISPVHRWYRSFSTASAAARLRPYVLGRFRGIRVVRRGVSPRIVRALVVGTRGNRAVSGATLRARLGLRDTWAYFATVSSRSRPARPRARGAGTAVLRRAAPPLELHGEIVGPRAGRRARVQRRAGARWRRVDSFALPASGRYVWRTYARGTYRVVVDGFRGPPVRLIP